MAEIKLYHGSQVIIQKPVLNAGKLHNDYGQGFYCTEQIELAKEWACPARADGFANCYSLNTDGLDILNLLDEKYTTLNWLAVLVANRVFDLDTPIMKQGVNHLKSHFLPDISSYDVITGYRADDCYFSFARAFLSNQISYEQLKLAMKLGKHSEQIVLKSARAFEQIKYEGYQKADASIYYEKRMKRQETARKEYQEILSEDISGLFMREIVMEDIRENDSRL